MKRTIMTAVVMMLALSMAISGTIAYLSDTDSDVNVMTLGNVNIELLENGKAEDGFENGQPLYPAYYEDAWENTPVKNGAIQKEVNVKNIGSSEAYVRTLIAFEAGELTKTDFDKYIHTAWETKPTWIDGAITVKDVKYYVAYVDYDVVAAGAETADSLQKIVMDKTATNEIVAEFGDTYEVLVLTQAIQTNNFPNKATAWKEGFGEMTSENVAKWFGGVAYNTVYEVGSEKELKELKEALELMKDQPYAVIKLTDDVTWETGAGIGSTPIVPADSAVKKLVIDGQGVYTLTATGKGVGSLRAANGGTIAFKDITIDDKSVSYAEDAWEYTYLEFAGNLTFDHVTFKSGVQFQTEGEEAPLNATFTNCAFESNEASVYAAWISDGTAAFKNCSFNGTRGIKVHEDYGSEVASVTVDNCTFVLSGKPGMAIGTLNADTKVSITNSAFDTQAGDQNLFIYETDTDVSSFDFHQSGNTLAVTVKNAGDLVAIANNGSAYGGKIIKLVADIDLAGIEWEPIVIFQPENPFVFDGQGHIIYNMTVTGGADQGLFDNSVGTIKNVTIENANMKTAGRSAFIAGSHYGNIENCHVKNSVIEDSYWAVGGIVGLHNSGSIKDCSITKATIKSNGGVGGIVGVINETDGTRTVQNCHVKDSTINNTGVYGEAYSGAGIVGMVNIENSTVNVTGCTSNATLVGNHIFEICAPVGTDITLNIN